MAQHHEETHITVADNGYANVRRWVDFCRAHSIKPLHIELNTLERQLMCAIRTHGRDDVNWWTGEVAKAGFKVTRIKQEIQPYVLDITTFGDDGKKFLDVPAPRDVVYYECHVKFDGPFRPFIYLSSRDLLREGRWYMTRRSRAPFDVDACVRMFTEWGASPDGWRGASQYAGHEYEAAVLDTNPKLDQHWESFSR